jgi:hypothetical protein
VTPDQINAAFEAAGAGVTLLNVRRLLRDRTVQGVSWVPTLFFAVWGGWNVVFYGDVHQPWSQAAGSALVAANAWWLWLLWRFTRAAH